MMQNVRVTIISSLRWVAVGLILGVVVLGAVASVPGGLIQVFAIQSGSMTPALNVGAGAIIRPGRAFGGGDIVAFHANERVIVHRVVGTRPGGGLITQGDANDSADPEFWHVTAKAVIGPVVVSVPYLGYVMAFLATWAGKLMVVIVLAALVLWRPSRPPAVLDRPTAVAVGV